ncbi:helix-turn-helix domain-containing protein [Henriciella sp. AS95]|uniref:helix-turn-helix domain-containing protein n=1 Tax=Henriciella sp. AS95 TaxID=3135782 RepID=UPI00317256B1
MMQMTYRRPGTGVRDLVGSYYCAVVPQAVEDVMRAEIANVRFVLEGTAYTGISGDEQACPAGSVLLCGPTQRWSSIRFDPGTRIFGAAITPTGWARIFDVPAYDLSDQFCALSTHIPAGHEAKIEAVLTAEDHDARSDAADTLFAALDNPGRKINTAFLDAVAVWLTDPEPNELEDLLATLDLSPRQIERLTKQYFGSSPKKLHRKFRALHAANRLAWDEARSWQEAATTAYFDQSHFIREFKEFNGRTPREFIQGAHLLVRQTLHERRQIEHHSPYSLVG